MNIIITGASGFIGQNITKYFKNNYENVIAVSRKKNNLVDYVVKDYGEVISLCNKDSFLIHLADNNINNNSANNFNLDILIELANFFSDKMIYISSAAVYAKSNNKLNENSPTFDHNNYVRNKLLSEKIVLNNNGIVLRLSNVYGKYMSKCTIFYDIIRQINSERIILNNFYSIRDFIFIDDISLLMHKIVLKPVSGIYNVGTGKATSIKKLTNEIIKNYGKKKDIYEYISKNTIKSSLVLDVSYVKKVFKWSAEFTINKGVEEFIKYEKKIAIFNK
tara:strand:+ start:94 stop:924 length:831 start_codon:yes stop_codon:yes gene_type:complete